MNKTVKNSDLVKFYDKLELGIIVLDSGLLIRYMNHWLKSHLPSDLAQARNLKDIFQDHDVSYMKNLVKNTIRTKSYRVLSQVFHSWILPLPDKRFSDGLMRQGISIMPLKDQASGELWAMLQIRDDSDKVLQVEKLHQEKRVTENVNKQLHDVVNDLNLAQRISKTGSWSWDLSTDIITLSDEMCRLLGIKTEEKLPGQLSYQRFLSRIHSEDQKTIEEAKTKSKDITSQITAQQAQDIINILLKGVE